MSDWVWLSGDALSDQIAWLNSVGSSRGCGWEADAGVFEDDIWVLHPMYENIHPRPSVRRAIPGDRVAWAEVWRRNGLTLGEGMIYPPSFTWLIGPGAQFPREGAFAREKLFTPEEDSMDALTMASLLPLLPGGTGKVHAVWDILGAAGIPREPMVNDGYDPIGAHASLEQVIEITIDDRRGLHTPNNFWPDDQSWLVLTAHDLWATQVFGSAELIASLEDAPELETLRWQPPE